VFQAYIPELTSLLEPSPELLDKHEILSESDFTYTVGEEIIDLQ
jgi:hypothetical protein